MLTNPLVCLFCRWHTPNVYFIFPTYTPTMINHFMAHYLVQVYLAVDSVILYTHTLCLPLAFGFVVVLSSVHSLHAIKLSKFSMAFRTCACVCVVITHLIPSLSPSRSLASFTSDNFDVSDICDIRPFHLFNSWNLCTYSIQIDINSCIEIIYFSLYLSREYCAIHQCVTLLQQSHCH